MCKSKFIFGSIFVLLLVLLTGTVAQAQDATAEATVEATPPPMPPDYVVILVVDDYTGKDIADVNIDIKQSEPEPDELCYLNPARVEGQAMADGMGSGVDINGNPIPHGNLVLAQVLDMINQYGPTPAGFGNTRISAAPVQVKGYTVSKIASAIQTAITDVTTAVEQDTSNPTIDFVVNMSFALVPCGKYDDLETLLESIEQDAHHDAPDNLADWNTFHNNLEGIMQETSDIYASQCSSNNKQSSFGLSVLGAKNLLSSLRQSTFPNCSLIQVLQAPNVVSVASAGNFGLDFPTLPAAWDNVVSVSAGQECDHNSGAAAADYNFKSAGGATNRLVFQKPTFGTSLRDRLGPDADPCESASDIATDVSQIIPTRAVIPFSSSGEIMMPGLWNYVEAFSRVQALKSGDLINLLGKGIYTGFYNDPNPPATPTPNPNPNPSSKPYFGYLLPNFGRVADFTMGSSFAAPKLSYAIAQYLALVGTSYCKNSSGSVIGFKYATFPNGPWNDYDLGHKTAIVNCDDFYDNTNIPSILKLSVH